MTSTTPNLTTYKTNTIAYISLLHSWAICHANMDTLNTVRYHHLLL